MIGVFGTAALQQAWGVTIWNQWDVYDAMLEHSFTGPMRFFVFLLAFYILPLWIYEGFEGDWSFVLRHLARGSSWPS